MRSRGAWLCWALACTSIACAFDSAGGSGGTDTGGDDDGDDGELDTVSADDDADDDDGPNTSTDTDASATDDGDGTTTAPGESTGSDTDVPQGFGCPSPLPPEWIFCSDFDGGSPEGAFSDWQPDPTRMGVVENEGLDGSSALEISHDPGNVWSGRVGVYFGDSPREGTMVYADDESLPEVWVRIFLRTEANWPSNGPGDLLSIDLETEDDEQIVAAARAPIYTPTMQQVLSVHAQRCFTAMDPGCGAPMSLGALAGTTSVYDVSRADTWQCIELHVGVDQGESLGIVELLVDDAQDAVREDYAFLQGFQENGWNALLVTGSWDGGPPQPLRRWIDDVVISRAPIGCG